MIRSIVFIIFLVSGIGFIIYTITKFLVALGPNSSRIAKEIENIKSLLAGGRQNLVPFDVEEFKLMSGQLKEVTEKGYSLGTFLTIYSEPIITYGYYNFTASERSVLVAQTSKDAFKYKFLETHVEVSINNHIVGKIEGNKFIGNREGLNYTFNDHSITDYTNIERENKVIGHVIKPMMSTTINSRAIKLEVELAEEELTLFTCLSIYLLLS